MTYITEFDLVARPADDDDRRLPLLEETRYRKSEIFCGRVLGMPIGAGPGALAGPYGGFTSQAFFRA